MKKIGVIGTGIFGTALALTAARAGNKVLCWDRKQDVVDSINQKHTNPKCLPGIPLPDAITADSEIAAVFEFSDVILLAASAQATRPVLQLMKPFVKKENIIVLCAKGIEAGTGKFSRKLPGKKYLTQPLPSYQDRVLPWILPNKNSLP